MEKCGKTKYVYIRMILNKLSQTLHCIFMRLWLTYIKCDLMLNIFPVICNCIVHMHRIPHNISKETYCILMERNSSKCNLSCLFTVVPFICRNNFSCCSVDYFPPTFDIISCIRFQHIRVKSLHYFHFKSFRLCCIERCHNIHLLNFFRIGFSPCIIFTSCIIC